MVRRVSRKLELFSIHAHEFGNDGYEGIFDALSKIPRERRISNVGGMIIGFPHVIRITEGYFIQALEGDPTDIPLIFDTSTGTTKDSNLEEGEMLGQATHFVVTPGDRLAGIEYVRRGAKALQLGPAIAGILRDNTRGLRSVKIEFAPKINKNFTREITAFERIRIARIRIVKPNASWTDHYTDLSDLMNDSDGAKADLDVRADRGASLKKNKGIVKVIKDITNDEHPYLEEATITGLRKNESAETTIRSSSHNIHTRAMIETDQTGAAYDSSIRGKLLEFMASWRG